MDYPFGETPCTLFKFLEFKKGYQDYVRLQTEGFMQEFV